MIQTRDSPRLMRPKTFFAASCFLVVEKIPGTRKRLPCIFAKMNGCARTQVSWLVSGCGLPARKSLCSCRRC